VDDTQWPRFQVFKQDREDLPFENVGSVHAPDAEMALQNARDVFVRRPECTGLWVVPADVIEDNSSEGCAIDAGKAQDSARAPQPFFVFVKSAPAGTHVFRGMVEATRPKEALSLARATLDDPAHPGFVWWVFPARAVLQSDRETTQSMFGPARDKLYRQPAFYRTDSMMRTIKDKNRREKGLAE
jgi:ring-1,2-phenylacetyl-CoA epoxidase subunit PaaB